MSPFPSVTLPVLLLALGLSVPAAADAGSPVAATELASVPPADNRAGAGELARTRDAKAEELALVFNCTTALMQGALEAADQSCGRAVALQPLDPAPHKLLGIARLMEKRYVGARDEFTEAVRLAPHDASNHIGLGEALRGQGNFDGSVRAFTVALKYSPRDAGIWNARCWTRGLFAREVRAGLQDCNRAYALAPASAQILDSRGLIYLRLGDVRMAIRNYNAAIALNQELPTAFYGRGAGELSLGLVPDGMKDITRARNIDAKIDGVFAEVPLLSRACRTALFTSSARRACADRPAGSTPKPARHRGYS